jgi:outer membrane protein assembly factor BamE
MKKNISLILIGLALSGCSWFHTHKIDIVQGNVLRQEEINELHIGMSKAEVKEILGEPILSNFFEANQLDYVYTYQPGYGTPVEKRLTCIFKQGRLAEIIRH